MKDVVAVEVSVDDRVDVIVVVKEDVIVVVLVVV